MRLKIELGKQGVFVTNLSELYNWGAELDLADAVWAACCAIEMIATTMARYDLARFGAELFRPSPRQADLMIVSGTRDKKMAPQVVRLYNQMAEPKYVIANGRLRHLRRAVQAGLQRAERDRPLYSCGRAYSRLPAAAGGADSGLHDVAGRRLTASRDGRAVRVSWMPRRRASFRSLSLESMIWSRRSTKVYGLCRW